MGDGLVGLVVDVEARSGCNLLKDNILHTTAVVIAAIANLHGLVLEVGFLFEEGVEEVLLAFVALVGLDLERRGRPGTAPAAATLDARLLCKEQFAIGREIFEHRRTLPIHIPIALSALSVARAAVARAAVDALDEDAQRVAVEIGLRARDGEDGQVDVARALDECSCSHGARQVAVAEETEAERAGDGGRKDARQRIVAVLLGGCAAVGGVAQGAAFGNGDVDGDT